MNIVLNGIITPVKGSPLATAPIRPDREINFGEKYPQGSPDTARLPRMAVYQDGVTAYTAYFPAAGIRGILRRMARNAVAEAAGHPWDIETHSALTIGGVKGAGTESSIDLKGGQALRQRYVIQSVFGQSAGLGASWVAGKLSVGFAVPETPLMPDVVTGVRFDDLTRNPDEGAFLTPEDYDRLTDLADAERTSTRLRAEKKKLERKVRAEKKAGNDAQADELQARIAAIEKEMASLDGLVRANVSVLMPLSGYEVIPPGTPLQHRMILRNADEAELGVLIRALEEFAKDPQLGAHAAHGCGIVRGEWRVTVDGQDLGVLHVKPFEGLSIDGEALSDLCDRAKSAFEASVKASPLAQGSEAS